MGRLLLSLSAILALSGLMSLNSATAGVGLIAFAGYIGVMARLAQAAAQHADVMGRLGGSK